MSIFDTMSLAFEALQRNLLRSVLTALGIIIGVAAVIVMMALGDGAQASIKERIQSVGANVIHGDRRSANIGGVRLGQGAVTTLTAADAKAIASEVPGVQFVSRGSTRARRLSRPRATGRPACRAPAAADRHPQLAGRDRPLLRR